MRFILFSCLICLFASIVDLSKIKVAVYYEALCGDSSNFIVNQLAPSYATLKDHFDIDLVPYGKAFHAKKNNEWRFNCQHGASECVGNKYQACALAQQGDQSNRLDFVTCVMRARNPSSIRLMQNCAQQAHFSWPEISRCATSRAGDELLAANGDKTNNLDVAISFVPTIVIDGSYDDYLQNAALDHLPAVICSRIVDDKPKECAGKQLPTNRSF